ncbi:YafY family transcriptional regulator [Trebonia kvetii]|uniref:YafY family transcriptional regulator n=1 Tax=Trebonia kvetii TaxID=2480626 RepID=A0A6P2C2A6_9ACTN|nr:YafY family protein [Trebonia kvetii]TVZ05097.1 YafY family transcriptional regulator [Trebonia kvetii]
MLDASARLLRLLSLLQSPREWNGTELGERLGVSPRTVRSDVEKLRELGYPVMARRGPAGGYRLGAGAAMPPLLLDDEEAVAVAVSLRTAAGGAVAGIEEAALRALAKLEQVLPSRLRARVGGLKSVITPVPLEATGPQVDPDVLSAVAAACRAQERLRFSYRSHEGSATDREAEPYRLVNWGRRWYLVAYDVGRAGWRTFRADRIRLRTPGGGRFTPRTLPSEDLAMWVSQRVATAGWRYRARVTVFAPAADVAVRIGSYAGTVSPAPADGSGEACVLDTGSDSLDTLAVYLGLLGWDFWVESPAELADRVRALADRYRRATAPL